VSEKVAELGEVVVELLGEKVGVGTSAVDCEIVGIGDDFDVGWWLGCLGDIVVKEGR